MLEKSIERRVVRDMKSIGCHVAKFIDAGRKGAPDRLCITPKGFDVFIETKTPTGELSEHQIEYHDDLRKHRKLVITINSLNEWIHWFDQNAWLLT